MLKLAASPQSPALISAAFRRLCVETADKYVEWVKKQQPPSGGCVLKLVDDESHDFYVSAAFRRLCVETA